MKKRTNISTAVLLAMAFCAPIALAQQPDPQQDPDVWPDYALDDDEAAREGRAVLPLTQDQIEAFGKLSRQTQRATVRGEGGPPEGRLRQLRLSGAEGTKLPKLAVARGYTTVLSFTDMTGAPWPIEEVVVDRRFLPNQERAVEEGSHLVYLVPQDPFANGNIAVKLKGLATPVMAMLLDDGTIADFRVDVRVPGTGPNADAQAIADPVSFHAGDTMLMDLLTGRVPAAAEALIIEGGDYRDRAWRLGSDILLITPRVLLSPGPFAVEHGSNGKRGYRLAETPLAIVSDSGRQQRLVFRRSPQAVATSGPGALPAVSVEVLLGSTGVLSP